MWKTYKTFDKQWQNVGKIGKLWEEFQTSLQEAIQSLEKQYTAKKSLWTATHTFKQLLKAINAYEIVEQLMKSMKHMYKHVAFYKKLTITRYNKL